MCTAITCMTDKFYFGRNLDYEFSYGEELVISPRRLVFPMRMTADLEKHYAIIGMAHLRGGYPLYYDAVNEAGLCIAGLSFEGMAHYESHTVPDKENIAQFELVPWLLGKCKSTAEARTLIGKMNMTDMQFSADLPTAQLHWLIADKEESLVLELTREGKRIYQNPFGVLTNNPPFPMQRLSLADYRGLSVKNPEDGLFKAVDCYSRGMGAVGLPGDLSSRSRFVRAAFVRAASRSKKGDYESISRVFHILSAVEQTYGCCEVANGKYEYTIYSACIDAASGVYYYKTYENSCISAVDMKKENLDGSEPISYPLASAQRIFRIN